MMSLGEQMQVMAVKFGSRAEKLGIEQGFEVTSIETEAERPDKEWIFIPALLLLAGVVMLQWPRLKREQKLPPTRPVAA